MKRFTKHLVVRYLISGGTSAIVNLAILSLLYYVFDVYYILAGIIAFSVAFFVSLSLHKFWTFDDTSMVGAHKQAGKYLIVSLFGLAINTFILYVCVDILHLYVYIGQIVAGGLTACVTFFISRDHVFNQSKEINVSVLNDIT